MNQKPRIPQPTAAGQPYGAAAQQQRDIAAVPMGAAPGPPPMAPRTRPEPTALDAPTERPDEPLEAGMPFGPGPGPEALNLPTPAAIDDPAVEDLRALYRLYPSEDLRELIEDADFGRM